MSVEETISRPGPRSRSSSYSLAEVVGGNGEDLGRWGREAGRPFRVQRLHRGDDVQRFPQQLDSSPFRNKSSREQMMDKTSGAGRPRVRHVFGKDLVGRLDQNLRILRFESEIRI